MYKPLLKKLELENIALKSILPKGQSVGESINITDSSNFNFEKFDILGNSIQNGEASLETPSEIKSVGENGSINVAVLNKNLVKFDDLSRNGITYHDTNKVTLKNATSYVYATVNLKSLSNLMKGKYVTITTITNGTVESGNDLDFIISSNKSTYKFETHLPTSGSPYINSVNTRRIKLADDEYLSAVNTYTRQSLTCDLEIELQIELADQRTDIVKHEEQDYIVPVQKPFRSVNDVRDIFIKQQNKWYEKHFIKRIESYNSEEIDTEYISSTGGLDVGSTVDYILKDPELIECTEEQTKVLEKIKEDLHTYKDTTNIFSEDEVGPVFELEYIKDLETLLKQS